MYLDNKYTKWYNSIINSAKTRITTEYCEKHHIIPRSLGGSNDSSNLVRLTGREHFICHWLLVKMVSGPARNKMVYALRMMRAISKDHGFGRYSSITTARVFERYREEHTIIHSAYMTGKPNWKKGLKTGPQPVEVRRKNSQSNLGKNLGKEPGNKGKPQPEYIKEKKRKSKPLVKCPHCQKTGGKSAMDRWHFSNCKLLVSSESFESRKS